MPTQIHYSASVQDAQGSRKVVDAYLTEASLSAEPAGINAWLAALDQVIDGVIVASQIRITPVLPTTLSGTGRSGFSTSRVESMGQLRFNLTGSQKHYTQAIPSWALANLSANKSPNVAATGPAAYVSLMTSSSFTDNTGLGAIASLYGAFGSYRKQKGLRKSTFVA